LADVHVALANAYVELGNRERAGELLVQAERIHAANNELGGHLKRPLRELAGRIAFHTN
jgi:hypothetical protein